MLATVCPCWPNRQQCQEQWWNAKSAPVCDCYNMWKTMTVSFKLELSVLGGWKTCCCLSSSRFWDWRICSISQCQQWPSNSSATGETSDSSWSIHKGWLDWETMSGAWTRPLCIQSRSGSLGSCLPCAPASFSSSYSTVWKLGQWLSSVSCLLAAKHSAKWL